MSSDWSLSGCQFTCHTPLNGERFAKSFLSTTDTVSVTVTVTAAAFALLLSAMQQECSFVAFYLVGRSVGVTGTETE